ncbi:MAG TPA: DUF3365 domain-containing protein [Burkholderiales bacterium]|nr:DUF3365 domain-containing protein [Burkholderiales bacterium]
MDLRRFIVFLLIALPCTARGDDVAARMQAARIVANELAQKLGAALREQLAASGPEGAISVCKDMAPQLAGELSRRTGWRVARVSLRTRNPLLGLPDAWEQLALQRFDQAAVRDEAPEKLEFGEIVVEPQGQYFRYVKALPVQPLCLICHGPQEVIAESVRSRLAAEYPHDRATGYVMGQIRGAVTIKQPLRGTAP